MVLLEAELLWAPDGSALAEPAKPSCHTTLGIAGGTQPLETWLVVSVEPELGGPVRTSQVEADEREPALNRPVMARAKGKAEGCNTPV